MGEEGRSPAQASLVLPLARLAVHVPTLNSAVSSGIYHILLTSFGYRANSGQADGQAVLELDKAECSLQRIELWRSYFYVRGQGESLTGRSLG